MKKYLLLIPLLTLIFVPNLVSAKTFEVNGETLEVTQDNYIYYFYTKYPDVFDKYQYFIGFTQSETGFAVLLTNSTNLTYESGMLGAFYDNVGVFHYFYLNSSNGYEQSVEKKTGGSTSQGTTLKYSNFDINIKTINFKSNISKQDLVDFTGKKTLYSITYYVNNEVYKTFEVEKGSSFDINSVTYDFDKKLYNFSGWTYDNTIDFSNISQNIEIRATLLEKDVQPVFITNMPITQNDFYTLLVLIGVLITMLFLKWCFPFKGGTDL